MGTPYAPNIFKALEGVFCVYKPADFSIGRLLYHVRNNIVQDLNKINVRPMRRKFFTDETKKDEDGLPMILDVPDLADHTLVIGPRYTAEDIDLKCITPLHKLSSGVTLLSCQNHSQLRKIQNRFNVRVHHVIGMLGTATNDFTVNGSIVERSKFKHVDHNRIDRVLAGMQAGHQRYMFQACNVDPQSQEAYELAIKGLIRPTDPQAGPVVYGMKCTAFSPPYFTLEIHSVNETCIYLHKLVHELGLELRTNATTVKLRRSNYGRFTTNHALLRKHWTPENIVENINICKKCLEKDRDNEKLIKRIDVTDDNFLLEDEDEEEVHLLPTTNE
ncbi:DgyrCDS6448 [Dimorphilus gyrociliatus]|uniref:DgyrCDS6448 n=1 Tax=Dimorphilus gyrociliatus TaxID=2664684 RepID=A0A7I8VPP8_9ANNE|nr:DgyrCDS6448 [Dimorphilus gyrociliatus]